MTGISNLVAAQLSLAAYTPLLHYRLGTVGLTQYQDGTNPVAALPSGWRVDSVLSDTSDNTSTGDNQFIVFVNDATRQVVIAFKGTNTDSQIRSDLLDNGASAWSTIASKATISYEGTENSPGITTAYSGYEIMTDGHSLGGGMAQTFALENGLNGYGQNSLPLIAMTSADFSKYNTYQQINVFTEVNSDGDIATSSYGRGATYLDNSPTILANPYAAQVKAGAALQKYFTSAFMGTLISTKAGANAHLIQTVISSLQSGSIAGQTTSLSAEQIDAVRNAILGTSSIISQNGSSVITMSDGGVFTVSPNPAGTALTALSALPSGQNYFFDGIGNYGLSISGSSLVGHETALVSNASGLLQFAQRTSSGTGILELPDGTQINTGLPSAANAKILSLTSDNGSPETALTSYLASIGSSVNTVAAIDQLRMTEQHPGGATPYAPSGGFNSGHNFTKTVPSGVSSNGFIEVAFYLSDLASPGAQIIGDITDPNTYYDNTLHQYVTVTAPAHNTLYLTDLYGAIGSPSGSYDLTKDTISNVNKLVLGNGGSEVRNNLTIYLTQAQFAGIGDISGSHSVFHAETSGVYDFSSKSSSFGLSQVTLVADSWSGTTLIGKGDALLQASLYGNDILQAGDGGTTITSGYGVDTITGGAGADTIKLLAGQLAAGSSINGGAGTDTITSNASATDALDISRATVSGVENLAINAASVTLNAGELGGFSGLQTPTRKSLNPENRL